MPMSETSDKEYDAVLRRRPMEPKANVESKASINAFCITSDERMPKVFLLRYRRSGTKWAPRRRSIGCGVGTTKWNGTVRML